MAHNRKVVMTAIGGPEVIRLEVEPTIPEPGPGMIRVRIEASSLVFTDMLIRRNLYPLLKPTPPVVLGYDLVGTVDTLGSGVSGPAVGTRVAALTQIGGGQDWICLPVEKLLALPNGLDPIETEPLILSYMTAYQALVRIGGLKAGGKVLIVGASGAVGLAALDLGRALGWQVTGVASARREELIRGMNAQFVAYDRPETVRFLDQFAMQCGGFDAILDTAGAESLRTQLTRLSPKGNYVACGFTDHLRRGRADAQGVAKLLGVVRLGLSFLRVKLAERLGSRVRFYDITGLQAAQPEWFRSDLNTLANLLAAQRIRPQIAEVFPPERAAEAHALIEAASVVGRLVLDMRARDD